MKVTTIIYKSLVLILRYLPFKKYLFYLIKFSNSLTIKLYKDLKFKGKFKVRLLNKSFLLNHFGGRIENETFWFGLFKSFEVDTGWLWVKLASKSKVVFDIGANTGIYSLVAKTVHSNSKIYAFEPSRNTFHKLVKNNIDNKFDINCFQIAFSNKNGEAIFYDSFNHNQTSASLSSEMMKNWKNFNSNEYKVKTQTIDDFIIENNITSIDLVKIDVEMHEPEVLEGFKKCHLLKPIIFIEILNDQVAKRVNEFFNSGFVFYHLEAENKVNKVEEIKMVPLKWNYLICPIEKESYLKGMI